VLRVSGFGFRMWNVGFTPLTAWRSAYETLPLLPGLIESRRVFIINTISHGELEAFLANSSDTLGRNRIHYEYEIG